MPTYEYECSECLHLFEELQSIKASPLLKCPKCSKDTLVRLVSGGGGVIFRGEGWPTKAGRIESSPVFKKQKEVYDQSYGGVDVSAAQQHIQRAGRRSRKQK